MTGDLVGVIELIEQIITQNLLHLGHCGSGMKAVRKQQKNVLFCYSSSVQLIQTGPDGHTTMGGRLGASLHNVRNDEDHCLAGASQLPQRLHADGVLDRLQGGSIQAVPVLGQTRGIGHGFTGDKDIGAVRQFGAHKALAVFKIQFHAGNILSKHKVWVKAWSRDFVVVTTKYLI